MVDLHMDTPNDYYAVLGVDSQASADTVKAAFKKLALQYHPDVYKGTDAQERMRGLLQAYQTLNDPAARKEYDIQRQIGGHWGVAERSGPRTVGGVGRDEQGHYAFPDLRETPISTLSFLLDGLAYQLSSAQAESLKWDGMLRGIMADPLVTLAGAFYNCQRCRHRWQTSERGRLLSCPACHAGDWAEYLLLRCTHCHAVFASKEIHDPLRGNSLYHPYELFPLCPHCRRSQWCPTEDGRVISLRVAAARRATLLWSSVIGVCVVLIALLALAALR